MELCLRSKIITSRCFRAHDSAVAMQMEQAGDAFDQARQDMVAEQIDLLASQPNVAIAALMTTGLGCRAILDRWGRYGRALRAQGCWRPGTCAEAIRLLGIVPEVDTIKQDRRAYLLMYCNLRCQPGDSAEQLAELARPENRPATVSGEDLAGFFGAAAPCRNWMLGLVEHQLAALGEREEELRTGLDVMQRSNVVSPTLLIQDPTEASRFFRYFGSSTSTFVRCHKELEATRERDAKAAGGEVEAGRGGGGRRGAVASGAGSGPEGTRVASAEGLADAIPTPRRATPGPATNEPGPDVASAEGLADAAPAPGPASPGPATNEPGPGPAPAGPAAAPAADESVAAPATQAARRGCENARGGERPGRTWDERRA